MICHQSYFLLHSDMEWSAPVRLDLVITAINVPVGKGFTLISTLKLLNLPHFLFQFLVLHIHKIASASCLHLSLCYKMQVFSQVSHSICHFWGSLLKLLPSIGITASVSKVLWICSFPLLWFGLRTLLNPFQLQIYFSVCVVFWFCFVQL